jgi:phosphoglycerate dehydrogenase-like enzyme
MKVVAYDLVWDEQFAREYDVTRGSLREVLSSADFVSLCVSLNDTTRGLIDAEALAAMKPTAYLINTARGAVVDEVAVCEALAEGRLAGYGTDVLTNSPPSADDPLLQFDNVVVTPHVAAASKKANARTNGLAAECAAKILTGQPAPEGCVLNPEIWPRWRGRE